MKMIIPLQMQAYDSLKNMILSGKLEHHKIYSETRLAQSLNISRTPFRDAVQRLAQEGYVDVIPSKGFRIHELTKQDLLETCQLRCALEGFCVVNLARTCMLESTLRTLSELESLVDRQEAAAGEGSVEDFASLDEEFHRKIVSSLENSMVTSAFDACHYQMSSQIHLSLRVEGRRGEIVEEHRSILEGIRSGSVSRSYSAALLHLEKPKGLLPTEN